MKRELVRMEAKAVRQRQNLESTEVMIDLMRESVREAEVAALAVVR